MLDLADHPALEANGRHIQKLSKQFGEVAWATIYQVDVRMRREMMSRIREEQTDLLETALTANGNYNFDPARPWGSCYLQAVTGQRWLTYWNDEVTVKCFTIMLKDCWA